jgi:predicted secreted protein with PEFG-CTERM motif
MNKRLGIFLLIIIISAAGIGPVFASPALLQNSTVTNPNLVASAASSGAITVATDKTSYNDGDKILISGITQEYVSSTPVTVMIISPIGNIVKLDQVNTGADKTYSTSIMASGALWQAAGAYTVKVQFGDKSRTAETTFQFSGSAGGVGGPTMKVEGTDFSVKYSITNGQVLGIKPDTQAKSLIVSVQTTGDGVLTITLPRGLIDSKTSNNTDTKFIVMNDGQEATYDETSTRTTDRTISIPFVGGTTQIEIVGTFAIPEFGMMAAVILGIAIASIVIVSRTGLRFGKY